MVGLIHKSEDFFFFAFVSYKILVVVSKTGYPL